MRALVLGDVIIDHYAHSTRLGLSAETPTVVGKVTKEETFIGGAGLVVRNLLRLGCEVTLVTNGSGIWTLGQLFRGSADHPTEDEMDLLHIPIKIFSEEAGWRATEKRRYFVDGYKLLQHDVLNEGHWGTNEEHRLVSWVAGELKARKYDALVICDNRHGFFTHTISEGVIKAARDADVPSFVDSQISQSKSNHLSYVGADWIFLNLPEAYGILQLSLVDRFSGALEARMVADILHAGVVIKMGGGGAMSYSAGQSEISQGFKVSAVDTCGAGDAFMAAFVVHRNLEEANRWAALSTTYMGTVVPKIEDLQRVTR